MAASIVADKLTKYYSGEKSPALRNLSLNIAAGEVYGFLGANGAGKSTTIRLLMNFLQPSSGSASICGLDSVRQSVAAKRHIGYLAGDVALPQKVTGKELFDYLSLLQGGSDRSYRRELEKRFEAETHKPIGSLSKGNRQKIGILLALMHQPDVLILDEPTSGLDPLMQEAFYDCLREAKARGAAVLMSSHNLAEAQRVCDRIGIIKHGKLIREESMQDATALTKPLFKVVTTTAAGLTKLVKSPQLHHLSTQSDTAGVFQPVNGLSPALHALSQVELREFTSQQASLEDEFIEFYGDNLS